MNKTTIESRPVHAPVAIALAITILLTSREALANGRDYIYMNGRVIAIDTNIVTAPLASRIGVFRDSDSKWYVDYDGDRTWEGPNIDRNYLFQGSDYEYEPVVGDWNGDGTLDIGKFRNGDWLFDMNDNHEWDWPNGADRIFYFGVAGNIPVVGDWSGSGRLNIGVYFDGYWYVDYNGNNVWDGVFVDRIYAFGGPGDKPIVGRFGTGRIGIFRGNGQWYVDSTGNNEWTPGGDSIYQYGQTNDIPVVGDWGGNGVLRIGVYRPDPNAIWHFDMNNDRVLNSNDAFNYFGFGTDKPIVGNWN